ncbi:DUF938 domain-containing protein [Pseudoalteromonas phenolica]|uniref:Methylase n=1 Tax=Pseudoalteromonas phenolica TaxID=161398 RepID=A0A0S2K6P0_9GAMM|nr:DUF938 domain-containing protein [Pseudoalteromonas phenolica]ALO43965.1 methylase [Pseudoalteromonas phenolica]MBE0356938.1 hypothetical protein [Pseudoalteromonas phenolica O-BC30]RXE95362.1 DUF938 domain-containing protein [Pseudoalteromonas phenolica O-BC30]
MTKPYSQACENNKDPILSKIRRYLTGKERILEVGSGTGQHAVHFARHLPNISWYTADQAMHHEGINAWLDEANLSNLIAPITLDLNHDWPVTEKYDAIYTANTFHIVSEPLVERLIKGATKHSQAQSHLFIYGPFNYNGQFTSESNQGFDAMLRARDPQSGIRDQEWVVSLAKKHGFELVQDHEMPANNRLLVFKR